MNRIKVCRKSELKKEKGEAQNPEREKENDKKMDELAHKFEDIFKGIGKY